MYLCVIPVEFAGRWAAVRVSSVLSSELTAEKVHRLSFCLDRIATKEISTCIRKHVRSGCMGRKMSLQNNLFYKYDYYEYSWANDHLNESHIHTYTPRAHKPTRKKIAFLKREFDFASSTFELAYEWVTTHFLLFRIFLSYCFALLLSSIAGLWYYAYQFCAIWLPSAINFQSS